MYSVVFGTVLNKVLVTSYMNQGRGCSSGNESVQPETLTSDYSSLHSAVYSTVYTVQCSGKYSIGMCDVHELIGW